jgi:uncharacterized protein YcfJ
MQVSFCFKLLPLILKNNILAAVGATAVGGPVGFAAGSAALGIMAGVGGALAGIFGGRVLKKQAQEARKIPTNEETNQS